MSAFCHLKIKDSRTGSASEACRFKSCIACPHYDQLKDKRKPLLSYPWFHSSLSFKLCMRDKRCVFSSKWQMSTSEPPMGLHYAIQECYILNWEACLGWNVLSREHTAMKATNREVIEMGLLHIILVAEMLWTCRLKYTYFPVCGTETYDPEV